MLTRITLEQLAHRISEEISKVFEEQLPADLESLIREQMKSLPGVDSMRVKFSLLGDEHNIRFGNLYTALIYLGYWDRENQCFGGGVYTKTQLGLKDYFTFDNGNVMELSNDGDINIKPIKPIKYIAFKMQITKEGAVFNVN